MGSLPRAEWNGICISIFMDETAALKARLQAVEVGPSISHENLTLFPLTDGNSPGRAYLLLEEALATGKLRVTERGRGTVPQLHLVNDTGRMVFLMEGETLVGAKQNRALNTSMLVAAESSIDIPVSCVEQGRWSLTSQEMSRGPIAYPDLRRLKNLDVHESLQRSSSYRADQGRVWRSVHAKLAAMGVRSATVSMDEAYGTHEPALRSFAERLACPQGACGVIAAIDGRVVCADLFDSPATLEKLWPRLVGSYAIDALEAREGRRRGRVHAAPARQAEGRGPAAGNQGAARFLEIPGDVQAEVFPSPGLGSSVRLRHAGGAGSALVYEGRIVHAALFGAGLQTAFSGGSVCQSSWRLRA